jgi:hypothetical protein
VAAVVAINRVIQRIILGMMHASLVIVAGGLFEGQFFSIAAVGSMIS